jgi:hypothetical protein
MGHPDTNHRDENQRVVRDESSPIVQKRETSASTTQVVVTPRERSTTSRSVDRVMREIGETEEWGPAVVYPN